MALVQRSYSKVSSLITRISIRCYSTPVEQKIQKSVFLSQSKDIYTNLAFEEWLYRNFEFKNHHVLMLWQSDPCVVIGRHQNPWLEANVPELPYISDDGVTLARRNSGGGTVFHDHGNLNFTFFTAREHYNRKYNLEILKKSLFREYGLRVDISPREDLTVSGTAAKLGRTNAYHHCTLLVNSNKVDLSLALQKPEVDIKTNATRSIKSKIMNLCEECPKISIKKLITSVGWEYMRTHPLRSTDEGIEFANKQRGFQLINPTEQWFPGLDAIRNEYAGWDWCYGKTPKFNITKSFKVPDSLAYMYGTSGELEVTMVVDKGRIIDVLLYAPPDMAAKGFTGEASVVTTLIGQKFTEHALHSLEYLLGNLESDKDRFVTECLKQVMTAA